jgi:hypothetical protein
MYFISLPDPKDRIESAWFWALINPSLPSDAIVPDNKAALGDIRVDSYSPWAARYSQEKYILTI